MKQNKEIIEKTKKIYSTIFSIILGVVIYLFAGGKIISMPEGIQHRGVFNVIGGIIIFTVFFLAWYVFLWFIKKKYKEKIHNEK
jgi:predicted Na+-dependent transporter